ncbi:hypothetical protein [Butyrivibrio sp.]|uniref:hypothetical protein n=1 Tax=Butyrivibrio sp. TaxID=28121 RepID=UPI0025BD31F1|nr:hypothetical protein [Butyrivibrio sp.]MBQ7430262.1 hypothetical protein [Butyrivibrio sp.]MBQ9303436.1 hypothetical protein [Butyrivibrio sp.]
MDSLEKSFSNSFAIIILVLMLSFISIMFGAAYTYADYKISGEVPNISLIKTGTDTLTEDEDYTLYTGRTSYSTSFGDEVETNMNIEGDTYKTVTKTNDGSDVSKTGEATTGAAVFAEIRSLPDSVTSVTINGHTLYNSVSKSDQKTVGSYANIAYYVKRGLIDELIDECSIGFTQNYNRSYIYDGTYDYITGIVYTPLS